MHLKIIANPPKISFDKSAGVQAPAMIKPTQKTGWEELGIKPDTLIKKTMYWHFLRQLHQALRDIAELKLDPSRFIDHADLMLSCFTAKLKALNQVLETKVVTDLDKEDAEMLIRLTLQYTSNCDTALIQRNQQALSEEIPSLKQAIVWAYIQNSNTDTDIDVDTFPQQICADLFPVLLSVNKDKWNEMILKLDERIDEVLDAILEKVSYEKVLDALELQIVTSVIEDVFFFLETGGSYEDSSTLKEGFFSFYRNAFKTLRAKPFQKIGLLEGSIVSYTLINPDYTGTQKNLEMAIRRLYILLMTRDASDSDQDIIDGLMEKMEKKIQILSNKEAWQRAVSIPKYTVTPPPINYLQLIEFGLFLFSILVGFVMPNIFTIIPPEKNIQYSNGGWTINPETPSAASTPPNPKTPSAAPTPPQCAVTHLIRPQNVSGVCTRMD